MDEKVIELLGKILENQTETNNQLYELTSRVKHLESKIENDITEKIRSLYDARETQINKTDKIIDVLESIDIKIDVLQMETTHVRKVK